jgi:quercetin dioxygenase-like cupin family protein
MIAGNCKEQATVANEFMISNWGKQITLANGTSVVVPKIGPLQKTMATTKGNISGEGLVSNGEMGGDLMFIPAGRGFHPHTHPGHHLLIIVEGECITTIDAEIHRLVAGQICLIPGDVPHAVSSVSDTTMIAIGSPHYPVDSEERLKLVDYESVLVNLNDTIQCIGCDNQSYFSLKDVQKGDGSIHCPNMLPGGKCRLDCSAKE